MLTMHMHPKPMQDACHVGARVMVPVHWATFWLSREPAWNRSNAPALRESAAGAGSGELVDHAVGHSRHSEHPAVADFDRHVDFGRHLAIT
jgi:hypothetical protein